MELTERMTNFIFRHLPLNNSNIYQNCRAYIDHYNNDNNEDMDKNGESRLLRQYLPGAQIVFDVGANVGEWANKALSISPSVSLHCFEPSHSTYTKLLDNHFSSNVICNHFGLSSSAHQAELYIFEEGSGKNSLYQRRGLEDGWNLPTQTRSERIELRTLDDYCSEKGITQIDFLKVDIEGHELELFQGAQNMLKNKRIKLIQFEYGGCNIDANVLLKDFFEFFSDYPNYRFYKIHPDSLRFVKRYDQRLENFQYQNWAVVFEE
jgi:FkbM family methyltransferase